MDVGVIVIAREGDVMRGCGSDGRESCVRGGWGIGKGRRWRQEWSVDPGSVVVVGCLVIDRVNVGRRHVMWVEKQGKRAF
jgi:hypothetical protein